MIKAVIMKPAIELMITLAKWQSENVQLWLWQMIRVDFPVISIMMIVFVFCKYKANKLLHSTSLVCNKANKFLHSTSLVL